MIDTIIIEFTSIDFEMKYFAKSISSQILEHRYQELEITI